MSTLLCLKEEIFWVFFNRASMWKAFMLGREGLQLLYLIVSLFPNVTGVANLNCLIAFGLGECWYYLLEECKSPFILSNWGASVKKLVAWDAALLSGGQETPPEGSWGYLPSVILLFFYFFFNFFSQGVGGRWFWVTRDPDTLTKCLKVRWAECRQLFRSLVVAKAFCYGCVHRLSKLARMTVITTWKSCMAAANCCFGSAWERLYWFL